MVATVTCALAHNSKDEHEYTLYVDGEKVGYFSFYVLPLGELPLADSSYGEVDRITGLQVTANTPVARFANPRVDKDKRLRGYGSGAAYLATGMALKAGVQLMLAEVANADKFWATLGYKQVPDWSIWVSTVADVQKSALAEVNKHNLTVS
ncbi:hypothetical protein NE236_01275 [Actinoallomurus purpureus]|uniref:hypothetical protein n=1 Tax=Actinoallomurus purpureus TaxID=478114 RepID=UPI002091FFF6|nr:hypothetical protein [Actinoallomurus purpureus]MCO6003602.1 hypothetical protein [Actinoallomurus purpureus]